MTLNEIVRNCGPEFRKIDQFMVLWRADPSYPGDMGGFLASFFPYQHGVRWAPVLICGEEIQTLRRIVRADPDAAVASWQDTAALAEVSGQEAAERLRGLYERKDTRAKDVLRESERLQAEYFKRRMDKKQTRPRTVDDVMICYGVLIGAPRMRIMPEGTQNDKGRTTKKNPVSKIL